MGEQQSRKSRVSLRTLLVTLILCLLPISELRGGLPYALSNDIPLLAAYPICVVANALVAPLVYLFLPSLHSSWNAGRCIGGCSTRSWNAPVVRYTPRWRSTATWD